ncbi:DUF5305 domain-containing protein [Halorarius halobius]|uniref:DUF5305 domain-containing protein n=1 Tax=Halorarius halobius TaxID=2962671 RepID=UPI0020CD924C|nr:DUF5305 domain-containing protein [Halorarius halobius]
MSTGTQAKHVVATRGPTVAVVLVLVGVFALGGAGWLVAFPPTEQVTEQRAEQTFASDVETSALVTGSTPLYAEGVRLRDKPVYLLAAAPEATYSVETSVPEGPTVAVSQRLVLVYEGTRNGETFWQTERLLVNESQRVTDGTARANATLNMSAVAQRLQSVRSAVGGVGVFETRLELRVDYRSNRYEGTLNASAPLQVTGRAYWVDGDLSGSRTQSRSVSRTVTRQPDPLLVGSLVLVGALALVGAGGVAYVYRDLDVDSVATETVRSRYEEWISEGEFPSGPDKRYIRINTLEDLVDVAIDSNKRVIYDDVYQAYAVADGDLVYYYTDDYDRIAPWLNM